VELARRDDDDRGTSHNLLVLGHDATNEQQIIELGWAGARTGASRGVRAVAAGGTASG
jgi:hypothetical protein